MIYMHKAMAEAIPRLEACATFAGKYTNPERGLLLLVQLG
jgi:hypothetical protein